MFDITFECGIQVNSQFIIAFVYSNQIWGNTYSVICFMEIKEKTYYRRFFLLKLQFKVLVKVQVNWVGDMKLYTL